MMLKCWNDLLVQETLIVTVQVSLMVLVIGLWKEIVRPIFSKNNGSTINDANQVVSQHEV